MSWHPDSSRHHSSVRRKQAASVRPQQLPTLPLNNNQTEAMSFLSRLLVAFGLLLLSHAGYSAHEHTTLYGSIASLPLDITIETLVATALITTGLVLGADQLRPISWSVWAGEIEKRGGAENPFRGLEDRVGFWDIRAKRKDYADWMRGKDVMALKE